MASIAPHKDGYRAQVYVLGVRDSQVKRTLREAKAWAAARESEIRAEKATPPAELYSVKELFLRYAEEVSPRKRGPRAELLRINAFIRDYPALAALPLAEFKTPHLVEWRDSRLKEVKAASVLRDINLIRNIFTVARNEWHWIEHNPFTGFKRPRAAAPRTRRVDPWREVKPICRSLGYKTGRTPQTKSQEVALAFLIALRTGMRAGEILSLGKHNLNITRRVASVDHKTSHITGDVRHVPLSRHAVRLLTPLAEKERAFSLSSTLLDALFRKTKTRLSAAIPEITDLHFHDARAEALTRLSRKVDVMTLAKISGHKDLTILQNTYYRETAEQIAARL